MADVAIRTMGMTDVDAVASIHVASWQVAYRGIVADDILDNLSVQGRAEAWRVVLRDHEPGIVAVRDGRVIGLAGSGPARDEDVPGLGELYAIYVAPDEWSTGAGAAMLSSVMDALKLRFPAAVLWVLRDNTRARRFYEAFGWGPDGSEQALESLGDIIEVRYRIDF